MRPLLTKIALVSLALLGTPSLQAVSFGDPSSGQHLAGALLLLLLVVCAQLGLLAAGLIYAVLEPRRVEFGSRLQRQAPWQNFRTGVIVFIILLLFSVFFANLHPPKGLAFLIWLPLLLILAYLLIIGFTMTAHGIGERIQSNLNSRTIGSTFLAVLYGGIVLLGIAFLPVLGLVLLFVVALISLGTAVRTLSAKPPAGPPAAPAVGTPPAPVN